MGFRASKFPDDMPEDRLEVYLEVTGDNLRSIKARAFGSALQLIDFWQQALK